MTHSELLLETIGDWISTGGVGDEGGVSMAAALESSTAASLVKRSTTDLNSLAISAFLNRRANWWCSTWWMETNEIMSLWGHVIVAGPYNPWQWNQKLMKDLEEHHPKTLINSKKHFPSRQSYQTNIVIDPHTKVGFDWLSDCFLP